MPLIERLMGVGPDKIPVHQFQAIVAEWSRGNMTGQQALDAVVMLTGVSLDSEAITEVQALVATVPGGSTAANKADRALRLLEIDQVLLLVDVGIPPYDDAANIRARLGI